MRDELDRYYTPDELAETLVGLLPVEPGDRCLEPSVGGGAFARALGRRGCDVYGVDIDPVAAGIEDCNFSVAPMDFLAYSPAHPPLWVIGNPPYRNAEAHVRHALEVTGRHVAFLLRLAMLESRQRIPLWDMAPLRQVWVLAERPSFTGRGTDRVAYGWFWFDLQHRGRPTLDWISWRRA